MASKKPKINKKFSLKMILVILILAIFIVAGYFSCYAICKNDRFEILGQEVVVLTVGDSYVDEGAAAIAFGKDISDKIVVEDNIDYQTPGSYFIKYTVDNFRYRGVIRYRQVIIEEVHSEDENHI